MPTSTPKRNLSIVIFVVFLIASIGLLLWQISGQVQKSFTDSFNNRNRSTVAISISFAPELEPILKDAINDFNTTMESGTNPATGKSLSNQDKKIKITGQSISSGEARTQIVSALNTSSNTTVLKPTIYAPTMSGWLNLVDTESGKNAFDLNQINSTATSPVGIAIWESRLNLIKKSRPGSAIGYKDILELSNNPLGWKSLNPNIDRSSIYSGFTDPQLSSTALSALTMQYYSATSIVNSLQSEQLSPTEIQSATVQEQVRAFQQSIRHYSSNTVVFRDYISRGPDYIDMIPLAENDLVYVNQGKSGNKPPEKLVMLYPKEGSVVHDYPMAIPQTDWVSDDQRVAANSFIDYIKSEKIQRKYLENGFRPANANIPLQNPISTDLGLDPNEPKKTLTIPNGENLSRMQTQWDFVKKTARVVMLLDTSGSMQGPKLDNAKQALSLFTERLSGRNYIGLTHFDNTVTQTLEPQSLESNRPKITSSIDELNANGSTALYDGLIKSIDQETMTPTDPNQPTSQIKGIILLSDGQDTSSKATLQDVVKKLEQARANGQDIILIPIAYGIDADYNTLNTLARTSKTTVQSSQANDIEKLFTNISSYF
jgi:Ca-activated chloride channel homolog